MAEDQINADYAVSTGSGSDRVSINSAVEFAGRTTRSLPLPVLTSLGIRLDAKLESISQRTNLEAPLKIGQFYWAARAEFHFNLPSRDQIKIVIRKEARVVRC